MKLVCVVALALVAACGAEWSWPEGAASASVRVDTKVRFVDDDRQTNQRDRIQADEPYHREQLFERLSGHPPGGGGAPGAPYGADDLHAGQRMHSHKYKSDGTLDSLQYCRCLSSPACELHRDSARACGSGKFLCCYKKPYKGQQNTEYFNEIDDERPMLLPGRESIGRPFPHPHDTDGFSGQGLGHEASLMEAARRGVLAGSQGPHATGGVADRGVLVSPGGPTGQIGLFNQNLGILGGVDVTGGRSPGVLVGPGGPTGVVGPAGVNKGVPIGPNSQRETLRLEETAQRGVLVGPGGPTGIIGPQGGYGRRPVLVGPGGPTGVVGPRRPGYGGYFNNGYGRPNGRGLLVGPGGPTGMVGPGRGLLVGPGGPTGSIGPQGYFGK